MIFKTWITDLTKLQSVVNNIKNIDAWANGSTRLLNSNVVTNLSSAINGLNLQQARLVLSTKNLTQEQMNQVLVQSGLIASENQIQAELVQSALAQSSVSAEKQKAILTELGLMDAKTNEMFVSKACTKEELLNMLATKGVTGVNAEAIISTLGLAGANKKATLSFGLFSKATWAQVKAQLALMAANPIAWILTVGGVIWGAVKAFDALTVSFDEAVEKTKSSKEELDKLISEINDLNNELKTTKDRIEELLEKANSGTISLLEEEELNNLREQNDELQREINLKEKLASIDAKEAAKDAAFSITYKTDDDKWDGEYHSEDRITKLERWLSSANHYQEELSKVNEQILNIEEAATDNSYKNDSVYQNLIKRQENYQKNIEKAEKNINSIYKELTDEDDGLYYNGKVVEGYEDLDERLNTIYTSVELYFDDGSIENTIEEYKTSIKNKLLETGLSEEISNAVAEGFSEEEINSIINSESIDWTKCLGLDSATAVIKNIKEQLASVGNTNKNPISSLSITDTIDQLNTQLKPTFDSLKSAYQDIFTTDDDGNELFTLENVDLSMLDKIKSAIDDLNKNEELGSSIDYSSFETLVNVLTNSESTAEDVRNAINGLSGTIVQSLNPSLQSTTVETYQLTQSMLESLGVANAEEVMLSALGYSLTELSALRKAASDAGFDLANATDSEISMFIWEQTEVGNCAQELYALQLKKVLLNGTTINTSADIEYILGLANSAGIASNALVKLAEAKQMLDTANANGDVRGIYEAKKYANQLRDEIQNDVINFKVPEINFDGTDKSKSKSSKSGGSKSEKDLWLEEYKRKLKELENMRDKDIINEREFFDQSETLLNTYLKDSQAHIEKYEEEISDAEKQLHDDWNAAYNSDAENLKKWQEKKLINMADYYQSMMNLQDEYYNSEALKLKDLADKMEAEYGRMSYVNLTRPSVDASDVQTAGYVTGLESSSVYAQSFGDDTKQVVVTPVLPNGTILSPDTLAGYASALLSGEKIDADIELAMFEGEDAAEQAEKYVSGLENMQSEYHNLKQTFEENPYGNFTEDQLKAVEELTKALEEHKSQLSSELGDIKSAYDSLIEVRDTYNKHGKISVDQYQSLCDMGFEYLALLSDESGALSLDEDAFQRLTDAKIQQIQVDMALQAADLIKNIQTEEQAVRYLADAYDNAAASALGMAENMLYTAKANAELIYGIDSVQAQAAANIVKGYENSKLLAGNIDIKMQSGGGYKEEKEEKKFLKTFDWIGTLLEKISNKTSKLIDKVDKFYSWQKKNNMINRAVKSTDREISQNELAYQAYMKKANSVGLGLNYVRKIQNGTLSIEDVTDEKLADKIDKYQEWYDKAQACLDTIEDLYDKQRDLIRQKLNNVLDYYNDMDSYLSSITSKIESIISLNDGMGKRTSLTELVEQFAAVSDRLENAKTKNTAAAGITDQKTQEDSFGGSKKVAEANERDRKELADTIQTEIDDLDVKKTGNYKKLRDKIADTQSEIDRYKNKGWDKSKAKSYEKLQKELKDYYDLQKALDENATSDTIANYEKIYTKYQKLQNKINSGKTLSESEQKRYDSYAGQLDGLKARGQSALDSLRTELAEAEGTAPKQSEAERIQGEIDGIQSDLEGTATYQNLKRNIETTESSLAELDEVGYDNLPQKQKKAYDKMKKQLEDYYAQKKALDEGATASNIAEYNKTYLEWKKLQDKLDNGKNLTQSQWKQYNNYTKQLENFRNEKSDTMDGLKAALEEAKNPSDRLEQIEKTFEESSKGIRDSYLGQIDGINGEAENSQQYQNLKAKAQNLEQKKKDKGLSPSEQAKLDKYNAELNALETGATGANIKDYMKTWESWYTLEQKLEKNGKLSDSDAKKYDGYKAKLDAWNDEKQTQINDLLSLMEDDLEQLKMTYSENVSEAESEINDYYANLYSLAKQIAEYNVSSLQTQLAYLESCISYYKELVSLYDSFSGDKLVKILKDLGEISAGDEISRRQDLYSGYLDKLQEKYDTTLSQINEYSQLLKALETGDFESSMGIFSKAMEDYRAEGNTEMADKMQSVLDLLNERSINADNWGEFADEWANEWKEKLSSSKQELIGIAKEIQEVNDALREIRFENITNAIDELNRASGILSSIGNLIQDNWLFEPDGSLSEYGRAKAALLVSQLDDAQSQANEYLKLYNEIQENKDTYASDKAYNEALNEALQNHYSSLNNAASLENSIMDLMKKNAEAEINSLKKIIEARKKALQAKKEYYDYDKSIKNSQKEIDSLKAQIDALENLSDATDAATKAKLAQLKAELKEKEDALQETKDEHTFNLQIDALDEFANSLTEALDNSTKSVEEIIKEQQMVVESTKELCQTSIDSTNETLNRLIAFYSGMGISIDGKYVGTNLSDGINSDTESNKITVNTGINIQSSEIVSAISDSSAKIDSVKETLINHNSEAVSAVRENTNRINVIEQTLINNNSETINAINGTTSAVEQFKQEVATKFSELINSGELQKKLNFDTLGNSNSFSSQIQQNFSRSNNYLNTKDETPSVVNNVHYDCLLKVDGNVDKNALPDLETILQKACVYTKNNIYRNQTLIK